MFYFGVICIWEYKSISEMHENRELINCNASSTVNKKGGGKKLQKQQIILSNFLHVHNSWGGEHSLLISFIGEGSSYYLGLFLGSHAHTHW